MNDKPIGVFDSGVGGLTVLDDIIREFPHENIIYLGDTARVPYGPRGEQTVKKFAQELAKYLLDREVKALVIACNTISSIAPDHLKKEIDIPVIDVITPTVKEAVKRSKNKKIGVIGTTTTIKSGFYNEKLGDIDNNVEVKSKACPLFISIVEEGLVSEKLANVTAEYYLSEFKNEIDTLILGCTHFPLIEKSISEVLPGVQLIESGKPTAEELKKVLTENNLLNTSKESPVYEILVTDLTENVEELAANIFSKKISIKEVVL